MQGARVWSLVGELRPHMPHSVSVTKKKKTIILCLNSKIDLGIWRVVEKEGKCMWIYTVVVQSLHHVWLFATPWTATHRASLSFTVSWSLLRLMSTESVMPSNHLILLALFPSTVNLSQHQGLFSELTLCIRWPKYWNFSFSINPSDEYSNCFSLLLTGLISMQSKGLSRVFSNTTVQKHQFFRALPSLWSNSYICTWPLEKPQLWLVGPLLAKWCLCFLILFLGLS